MGILSTIYKPSLALLTDLYELTMAYGFWKTGRADDEAVFQHVFRKHPFGGGYTIACGLAPFLDYLRDLKFDTEDLDYLATLRGNDDAPLFAEGFLDYLCDMEIALEVDAVPEGTVVFPYEPLTRVQGPIIQCQIIETALLNLVNFQSLIATKAARVCASAGDEPVLEFGLRRAQGIDGALSVARATYIGGCAGTSNVLAGRLFNIPVKGTHAHSWVMAFDSERAAFDAYANAMPNNCVFLVDTYDSLQGVRNAITVAKRLQQEGHEVVGVRLDSGDLAYLSQKARAMLDEAGFQGAKILASNDLDEHIIRSLHEQKARIDSWGVGTKLATANDDPALGGVYKLSAIRENGGEWQYRLKLSEQLAKISLPGIPQVRRFTHQGEHVGDMIYDTEMGIEDENRIIDPMDTTRHKHLPADGETEELLVPVIRGGKVVYDDPGIEKTRERVKQQLARFHEGVRRLENPHQYPVGLESRLHAKRMQLVSEAREATEQERDDS